MGTELGHQPGIEIALSRTANPADRRMGTGVAAHSYGLSDKGIYFVIVMSSMSAIAIANLPTASLEHPGQSTARRPNTRHPTLGNCMAGSSFPAALPSS